MTYIKRPLTLEELKKRESVAEDIGDGFAANMSTNSFSDSWSRSSELRSPLSIHSSESSISSARDALQIALFSPKRLSSRKRDGSIQKDEQDALSPAKITDLSPIICTRRPSMRRRRLVPKKVSPFPILGELKSPTTVTEVVGEYHITKDIYDTTPSVEETSTETSARSITLRSESTCASLSNSNKRRVRFNPHVDHLNVESLGELAADCKASLWYQEAEFEGIHEKIHKIVAKVRAEGLKIKAGQKKVTCIRGLERLIELERVQEIRAHAVDSVLKLQQSSFGPIDYEEIATHYEDAAKESRREALDQARLDERDATSYYKKVPRDNV